MNARSKLVIVSLVSFLALGVGCRSATGSEERAASGNDCVFFRTIDNWQVLDDSSLVIWTTGNRRAYLVRLFRPSPDLRFAIDLRFQDGNGDGQLCPFGGDSVITGGTTADRYRISSMKRLSEKELEDLLAAKESTRGKRRKKSDDGDS
jgi:hypothetical protein